MQTERLLAIILEYEPSFRSSDIVFLVNNFAVQNQSGAGDEVLKTSVGPNSDGRFQVIGDVVRHIFSAEKRYVERLSGRALSDTSAIPNDNAEELFNFGETSRQELKTFLETFPDAEWDVQSDHKILTHTIRLTPRKIIM